MSESSLIQHDQTLPNAPHVNDCKSGADVMDRARRILEKRKASLERVNLGQPKIKVLPGSGLIVTIQDTTYSVREIQNAVCAAGDICQNELLSQRREKRLVMHRHVAILLCILLTRFSLGEIGRRFANMDHSSIIHIRGKTAELASELRPLLESVPLDYLVRIALEYAFQNYLPKPRKSR